MTGMGCEHAGMGLRGVAGGAAAAGAAATGGAAAAGVAVVGGCAADAGCFRPGIRSTGDGFSMAGHMMGERAWCSRSCTKAGRAWYPRA